MEWISCKDRQPNKSGRYLTLSIGQKFVNINMTIFVTSKEHLIFDANTLNNESKPCWVEYDTGMCEWINMNEHIQYWMPLPEVPERLLDKKKSLSWVKVSKEEE